MATVFWDTTGVILIEYLERGRTINADRYCATLTKLRETIRRKRPGLLSKGAILLHDNARPHAARQAQELLQRFKWEVWNHLIAKTFPLKTSMLLITLKNDFEKDDTTLITR